MPRPEEYQTEPTSSDAYLPYRELDVQVGGLDYVLTAPAPEPVVGNSPDMTPVKKLPASEPEAFGEAFNKARDKGLSGFTWKGKRYTTQMAEEKPATPSAKAPAARAPAFPDTNLPGLDSLGKSFADGADGGSTALTGKTFEQGSEPLTRTTPDMKASPMLPKRGLGAQIKDAELTQSRAQMAQPMQTGPIAPEDKRDAGTQAKDFALSYMKGSAAVSKGVGWLTGWDSLRDAGAEGEAYWADQQSQYLKELLTRAEKTDAKGYVNLVFQRPELIGQLIVESLPGMAAGMGPGAAFFRAGTALATRGVTSGLIARGAVDKAFIHGAGVRAAQGFAESSLAKYGIGALGAVSEGLISAGLTGDDVEQFILKQPLDQLRKDAEFASMEKQLGAEAARAEFAKKSANTAATKAGVAVAGLAGIGAPLEARLLTGRQGVDGVMAGSAKAAAIQGAEEAPQNIAEDYARYEQKSKVDPKQKFDPLKSGVQGALTGAPMGAGAALAAAVPMERPVSKAEILSRALEQPLVPDPTLSPLGAGPGLADYQATRPLIPHAGSAVSAPQGSPLAAPPSNPAEDDLVAALRNAASTLPPDTRGGDMQLPNDPVPSNAAEDDLTAALRAAESVSPGNTRGMLPSGLGAAQMAEPPAGMVPQLEGSPAELPSSPPAAAAQGAMPGEPADTGRGNPFDKIGISLEAAPWLPSPDLAEALGGLSQAEIAQALSMLDPEHAAEVAQLLPSNQAPQAIAPRNVRGAQDATFADQLLAAGPSMPVLLEGTPPRAIAKAISARPELAEPIRQALSAEDWEAVDGILRSTAAVPGAPGPVVGGQPAGGVANAPAGGSIGAVPGAAPGQLEASPSASEALPGPYTGEEAVVEDAAPGAPDDAPGAPDDSVDYSGYGNLTVTSMGTGGGNTVVVNNSSNYTQNNSTPDKTPEPWAPEPKKVTNLKSLEDLLRGHVPVGPAEASLHNELSALLVQAQTEPTVALPAAREAIRDYNNAVPEGDTYAQRDIVEISHAQKAIQGQHPGVQLQLVDPKTLPAGNPLQAAKSGTISQEVAGLISLVTQAVSGRKALFFTSSAPSIDGGFLPSRPKHIFINTRDVSVNPLRTTMHEVLHGIRFDDESIYQPLRDVVISELVGGDRALAGTYSEHFGGNRSIDDIVADLDKPAAHDKSRTLRDFLEEELVADLFGNRMTERAHWRKVFGKLGDNAAVKRLAQAIKAAIGRAQTALGGKSFAADKLVKDLDRVREAVATAQAEHMRSGNRGTALAREAAAMRASARRKSRKEQLAKHPDMAKVLRHLTDSELGNVTRATLEKIQSTMNSLPSAQDFAAAAWAGRAKRGWYRHSYDAIEKVFGKADAWRFAGLLAAMSPQVSVESNLLNALNTWKNWTAAGRPTDRAAILAVMGRSVQGDKGIESVLGAWRNNAFEALTADSFAGLMLSGPKVDSFMRNLLGFYQEVTNDAWMGNFALVPQTMFSGSKNESGPGKGPGYKAYSARVREAAALLSKNTGTSWSPAEVQETVWSWAMTMLEGMDASGETRSSAELIDAGLPSDDAINATPDFRGLFHSDTYGSILREAGYAEQLDALPLPDKSDDPGKAPFTAAKQDKLLKTAGLRLEFLQRQRRTNAQISWEARPGESTGVLPGMHGAPLAVQQQYLADVFAAIETTGFKTHLGISLRGTLFGPSAWEGKVLAGAQSITRPGIDPDGAGSVRVDNATRQTFDNISAVLGLVLNQEGVPWHYPIYTKEVSEANGVEINFGRPMTHAEAQELYAKVSKEAGHDQWAPAMTPIGARILNFTDTPNPEFHRQIKRALVRLKPWANGGTSRPFKSDGNFLGNNWKEQQNGEDYVGAITGSERSNILGWATGPLQAAVDAVNRRYSEQYDWGPATREDARGARLSARRPDAPGSGRDRSVASAAEPTLRPSYGTAQEHSVRATGVHYSTQPQTDLNGAFYGRGLEGAERARIMAAKDRRLRERIYFYASAGSGVTPEFGVGGYAHTVDLNNLYDGENDPLNLNDVRRGADNPDNAFESAVLDAGFDGFIVPFGANQKAAVLLGRHNVAVRQEPQGYRGEDTAPAGKSKPNARLVTARAIRDNRALPSGEMTGADWKRLIPRLMPELDVSHLDDNTRYYKDGLLPPRLSRSRFTSPLATAVTGAKQETMPAQQWKLWLASNKSKLGLKDDEINFSGVNDYLDLRGKDKVTKAEISDYLSGNGVVVNTVEKGKPGVAKFASYWEPSYKGGIPGTYREVLVTLPVAVDPRPEIEQKQKRLAAMEELAIEMPEKDFAGKADALRRTIAELKTRPVPKTSGSFKGHHWDEPNVLVHIRTDEVMGADGKRYLRVGEIQSDWGQTGKEKGFVVTEVPLNRDELVARLQPRYGNPIVAGNVADILIEAAPEDRAELLINDGGFAPGDAEVFLNAFSSGVLKNGVPNAPFVTDTKAWVALGIKQAIRQAIDAGVDGVVFGTGEQNANLYSLERQVDKLGYWKNRDGTYRVSATKVGGGGVVIGKAIQEGVLADHVGKDIAEKMLRGEGKVVAYANTENVKSDTPVKWRELQGPGLRVGGNGMRAFYDKIVPQVANDVLKKLGGGKISAVKLPTDDLRQSEIEALAERVGLDADGNYAPPGFAIPDAMREKIEADGIMLFSTRRHETNSRGARGPAAPGYDIPDGNAWRTFVYNFQDRFDSLDQAEKAPHAGDAKPYRAESLYHGMSTALVEDFDADHVKPLLAAIHDAGVSLDDVGRYLHARHAPEANRRLKAINPTRQNNDALSGMTDARAAQTIADFTAAGLLPALDAIAARTDAINKLRRDLLISADLEDAGIVRAWEKTYQFYAPLFREEMDTKMPMRGKGFDTRGKSKRRAGSERAVDTQNMVARIVAAHEATIVRSEKARVAREMLKFVQDNPAPHLWEVNPIDYAPRFDVNGLVTYARDPSYALADNVLEVREGGQVYHISFNTENEHGMRIVTGLKNLNATSGSAIIRALGQFNRYLSTINTSLNPEFTVVNFLRDIQTAGYNLTATEAKGLQLKIMGDVGKAFRGIVSAEMGGGTHAWSSHYRRFRDAGAKTGWLQSYEDITDRGANLQNELWRMQSGAPQAVVNGVLGVIDFVEKANVAIENAVRLSAFVHAREKFMAQGIPAAEATAKAASLAKELTVNFNRKGEQGTWLNALYLFANAAIQGSATILKTLSRSRTAQLLAAATVAAGFGLELLARALSDTDDDDELFYDKLPSHIKDRNMVFMLPNTGGQYAKLALPWGYNVFHVLGQEIAKSTMVPGYDKSAGALRFGAAVFDAYMPIGFGGSGLQWVSPTVLDPLAQLSENLSAFGTPLYPEDKFSKYPGPLADQHFKSARPASVWLADKMNRLGGGDEFESSWLDTWPATFDLLWNTGTGGLGRFVADTASLPFRAADDTLEAKSVPFLRKVYGEPDSKRGMMTYMGNRLKLAKVKDILANGSPEQQAAAREKYPAETLVVENGDFDFAEKYLGKVRKWHKQAETEPDTPARAAELKAFKEEERKAQVALNKALNHAKKLSE